MYSSFFAEFDPSTGNFSGVEQGKYSIQDFEPRVNLVKILKFQEFWCIQNLQTYLVE